MFHFTLKARMKNNRGFVALSQKTKQKKTEKNIQRECVCKITKWNILCVVY